MQCPACRHHLTPLKVAGVEVDTCSGGCGGLWFDQLELRRVDESRESEGASLLDIPRNPNTKVDTTRRRLCAKCDQMVMMRYFFSVKKSVEIDECPKCAGIFLDVGELDRIRNEFATEEARQAEARKVFGTLFDPSLAANKRESEKQMEVARRVAQALKFVCPTFWVPGKQGWGAF